MSEKRSQRANSAAYNLVENLGDMTAKWKRILKSIFIMNVNSFYTEICKSCSHDKLFGTANFIKIGRFLAIL